VLEKVGTQPYLDKVKVVIEFLVPRTITNIWTFIGFIRYYWNYVRGYARLATLLFELTKKDETFQWSPQC
jgi:hypothetical protein